MSNMVEGPRLSLKRTGDPRLPVYYASVVSLIASIFQGYIFSIGINITVFMLCLAATFRYIRISVFIRRAFAAGCLALILVQAISLSWAFDPMIGVKDVSFSLAFAAVLGLLLTLAEDSPEQLLRAARIYCAIALAQSLMVICFRLLPSVEAAFWASPLGRLCISPGALIQDGGLENTNVTDPAKAGGVLLAANQAGAWSGSLGFMTLAVYDRGDRRRRWIAAIHFVAMACSGSKASLGIAVGLSSILCLGWLFFSRADARVRALIWCLLLLLLLSVVLFGAASISPMSYESNSKVALESRTIMWSFAQQVFLANIWPGLGYGGWHEQFYRVGEAARSSGVNGNLAPHNLFLDLWVNNGLIAVCVAVYVIAAAYGTIIRGAGQNGSRTIFLVASLSFYLFQSLGENYVLFGVVYISPILALTVALGAIRSSSVGAPMTEYTVRVPNRSTRLRIPAVARRKA